MLASPGDETENRWCPTCPNLPYLFREFPKPILVLQDRAVFIHISLYIYYFYKKLKSNTIGRTPRTPSKKHWYQASLEVLTVSYPQKSVWTPVESRT